MNDPQLRWLRLWTDIIADPKIKMLAFEDRWHFVALLCMKRKGDLEAAGEFLERMVAVTLGVGDRERDELKRRLAEVHLIGEDWQPIAWEKRQFSSDCDKTAAERQRRYRERNALVTRESPVSHGRVTTLEQSRAEQNRAETEQSRAKRRRTAVSRRSKTVPEGWEFTEELRAFALAELPDLDIEGELAKFRDFEFRDAKYDWAKAWRRWVRTCKETGRYAKKSTHADPAIQSLLDQGYRFG